VFASADVQRWTLGDWPPGLLVGPDLLLFVGASALAAMTASRVAAAVTAVWTTGVTIALAAYSVAEGVAGWGVVLMSAATVGTAAAALTLWRGHLPVEWFFVGPFRFREAANRSGRAHLRRSLVQLVVFWTTFFLLIPWLLATIESELGLEWGALQARWLDLVAVAVFLPVSAFALWSCTSMALVGHGTPLPAETARDLVVVGPYRYVRNPMAVAGVLQTASVGLWLGSWMVLAAAVVGGWLWDAFIRPEEEADLAARFGEPYEAYRRTVRCWVPTFQEGP
jgi:protein-S-isoprenylcysteine O-methyltransferase Ste14